RNVTGVQTCALPIFTLVDTGGWDPDATGVAERISAQAELAVQAADAVVLVVDAMVGITDDDDTVVKVLRRADKPVVLAANKVDDQRGELTAAKIGRAACREGAKSPEGARQWKE